MQAKPPSAEFDVEQDPHSVLPGAIAAHLSVKLPDPKRNAQIASGLLQRARLSAEAHRGFLTRRREAREFTEVGPGVSSHTLRTSPGFSVHLTRLQPGALLTWPAGVEAQELLVMRGTLVVGGGVAVAAHELVLRKDESEILHGGPAGAYLYVRQLLNSAALPDLEQLWWSSSQAIQGSQWEPLSQGVDVKHLRRVGDVVSTLARVAPGAAVLDHGHRLDEECMMLQGDLFLGDILLREDDYQMAPAGGAHVHSMSDTGAVFYFHGNMPIPV